MVIMSVIALPPWAGLLESIANQFVRRSGIDFHAGSKVLWWTKLAVLLATATVSPYLILLIAIIVNLKHSSVSTAIQLTMCVFFCGWLLALPCVLAVLSSAVFGRYFVRALTILLPFFLFVGWDTLGLWWDWQDEESRLHDISFGDELLNWCFYAGQTIWTSGGKYLLCAIAIRLVVVLTAVLLRQCISTLASSMVSKV